MPISNNSMKVIQYFRYRIPTDNVETIVKKIAFVYFVHKVAINKPAVGGLESTVHEVINKINELGQSFEEMITNRDLAHRRVVKGYGLFKTKEEFINALKDGISDYSFFEMGSRYGCDSVEVGMLFDDLSKEELLELLNYQFTDYFSRRENYTPESIIDLVLKLSDKYVLEKHRVFDMACGTGNFLAKAAEKYRFVGGVELIEDNALITKMRLFANSISGEIRIGDCFKDSWEYQVSRPKFDLVFSQFPWKMRIKDFEQKEIMFNCNANRFILDGYSTTDYFFMSAMMNYLSREGVAITVVPISTLSNLSDSRVRRHMIERGFVKEVIALPTNLFPNTSIQTALIVLTFEPNDKVAFFDGTKYFTQVNRTTNRIDVDRLIKDFDESKKENLCFYNHNDLEKHEYSLSPLHYLNKIERIIPMATELVNAADVFTGWQVPSSKLEEIHKKDGTGVQLLQMSNVSDGTIISKLEKYEVPTNTIDKFKVETNDVVISTKSLKVKSAVVDIDLDEPVIASGSIMVIRPKKDVLDPYYLVAYFESNLGKQTLELYQSGSIIPNLSINNVKKLPIPLLPFEQQKKIGQSYKELRDLILSEKMRLERLDQKVKTMLDNLWDTKED